ncbi:hypothetical protein BGI40_06640 [Snodgrassella communis]|uniref:Uncharacterized protein n=1 Tax=Snodgrassella communis TaxID=2946699 RepID=A0A066TE26_9NEIS|nr:hypothetical protein [Snodgrassella communis]KDN11762.1 hypothetical protein SALWKB12_1966 [Snodgrassella communis]KDN14221.1 hypothetical protein SALWKB29_1711 [Snodgrassella communis]PIT06607.1 hypothetical protein BGI29_10875 [Snodgrassella communis]PIT25631.1 hypothetical protein BGI38_09845 [Snodgrassella communis]PIT27463.1 hypothetical protein BGI39_08360 [Snodgrassella communis]
MIKINYDLLTSGENVDYKMNRLSCYFQGQPFTGIAYEFKFGFVLVEAICINSWLVEYISFFADGTGRFKRYEWR